MGINGYPRVLKKSAHIFLSGYPTGKRAGNKHFFLRVVIIHTRPDPLPSLIVTLNKNVNFNIKVNLVSIWRGTKLLHIKKKLELN